MFQLSPKCRAKYYHERFRLWNSKNAQDLPCSFDSVNPFSSNFYITLNLICQHKTAIFRDDYWQGLLEKIDIPSSLIALSLQSPLRHWLHALEIPLKGLLLLSQDVPAEVYDLLDCLEFRCSLPMPPLQLRIRGPDCQPAVKEAGKKARHDADPEASFPSHFQPPVREGTSQWSPTFCIFRTHGSKSIFTGMLLE